MDISIKLNIYPRVVLKKPKGQTFGIIRNNMQTFDIRASTLKNLVQEFPFCCGSLSGTGSDGWQSQQLLGVDIDNDRSEGCLRPEEALDAFRGLNLPVFLAYRTFSYTEKKPRYRLLWLLKTPITDGNTVLRYTGGLVGIMNNILPGCCDTSASDLARIYLPGGKGCVFHSDDGAVIDLDVLESNFPFSSSSDREPEKPQIRVPAKKTLGVGSRYDAIQAEISDTIRNFNLLGHVQELTHETGKRIGKNIRFNRCPICNHHDCFGVSIDGHSWKCFSSGHGGITSGGIISFIQSAEGLSYGQAKDAFIQRYTAYDPEELLRLYKQERGNFNRWNNLLEEVGKRGKV